MTTLAKHPFNTVSWFDLMSPDPARAREFYTGLFGWTYQVGGPETGHYAMAQLAGRTAAGIGTLAKDSEHPSAWMVYFNVENAVEAAMAIVASQGLIVLPVMQVMDAGFMALAVDPSGAAFGIWQPVQHPGAQVVSEHGAMGWQECHTRDAQKARDFYTTVFGFRADKVPEMDYWLFMRGDTHLGGVYRDTRMPAHVPPHWLVYFDVTDTDAAIAKATATGGKLMMPASDTPHGRMAMLADPFGAVFAVIKPPS